MIIKWIGPLKGDQYYPVSNKKTAIFLHHTAGDSAASAVSWWNQTPENVGTALLVDRAGTALQCFDLDKWAYSLGVKGETSFEKVSVGIEIVAMGWLLKEGEEFVSYPLWPLKKKRVIIAKEDVIKLEKPWRGFTYYHKYNDAQIKTIIELCVYLVDRFKIVVQKDLSNFWEYNPEVFQKDMPGIWSHTTVRRDKSDIYPDPKLIAGLKEAFNNKAK